MNDLVNCPGDGIDIVSSDVHLILNEHQISGSGGAAQGGVLTYGFTLNGADQNTFRGNDSSGNGLLGPGEGFFLFDATENIVEGNTFNQNSESGILAQAGIGVNNTIRGNSAQGNSSFDLEDRNGCGFNVWQGNPLPQPVSRVFSKRLMCWPKWRCTENTRTS